MPRSNRFGTLHTTLWRGVPRRFVTLAALLVLGCIACSPSPTSPPAVMADGEMLLGSFAGDSTEVIAFKGIPFAAAPVGERRWQPPAPITPRRGVQQATEFGPGCVQQQGGMDYYRRIAETLGQDASLVPDLEPFSEDCLYLNVWTASWEDDELRPVMVWIHGGGNTSGAASEVYYDGANLARRGALVVTFNYRLNVFGFLAHPALTAESEHGSSGNYALLDQIAALRWVQRNIASFGGDPDRVTIFGESAGATDIAYLMSSPLARGLFHRAIMQSGGYTVSEFRTLADEEAVGEGLAAALGVAESNDVLAAMRSVSAEELHRSAAETYPAGLNAPNVDGWVLPTAPARIFDTGGHVQVPLMIGFNSDEWTSLRHYWPEVTVEGLREMFVTAYGGLADRATALYPAATDEQALAAADLWQSDCWFACPSKFIADRVGLAGGDVFFYLFTRRLPAPGGDVLGAYHGAEIPYVFDNVELEPWVPRGPDDQRLAEIMADYWVQFAASGDPNRDDLPTWPAYDSEGEALLELGDRINAGSGVRTGFCELYEELQAVRMADGG